LNIAFSDLAAYNVALQGSFASAEEAGTSFNAMLVKITTPATVAQLEEMGVAVENADGSFRDLTDIMADLGVALEGVNSDTERAAIVQELFGTYGQRAALSLTRQAAALPELKKEMRDLNLIEDQTNVKLDGMAQRLEIADNQMEKAKITMGQAMAPATLAAADAMGGFATALMMVPEPLQAIAGTGLTAAQSLIVIGPALAGIIPAINAYRASTFAATVATQGFTAALMLNPAALAAVAIGAVALSLGTYYLAARDAERASKDLNATGKSQLEIARDEVAAKRKDIEVTKEQIAYYEELIESNRRRARAAGIANDIESEVYLKGMLSTAKRDLEKLNGELDSSIEKLEDLEDAEIDIELSKSQHSVDTLESSLSELLRLMDELEGKERTKAELEDTEAVQEIRVRTSQKDLDEAKAALKAWEKGGDNAYAIEFGSEAAREEHQRLIDEVTKAQVDLNRATREYNDTQEELNGLEEEFAEKESRVNELAAEMNDTLPDLKLTLDDLAEGQDHVNQKVREAIAMTPAGIEALRIIDEFLASSSGAADTAPEGGPAVPVAVPGNEFYGKGYTPGYPEGFEVKEGGGLVRQPTGERTTTPPATTVAAQYAVEPLPAIQVEQPDPVIVDAKYRDEPLPKLGVENPDPVLLEARYRDEPLPAIQVEQPDPVIIDAQYRDEPLPKLGVENPDPVLLEAWYRDEPLPAIQVEQPDPVIVEARYAVEPLPAIQIEQPDPVIVEARYAIEPLPAIQVEQPDPVIIDAKYREDPLPTLNVEPPSPVLLDARYAVEPLPAIQIEQPDPVIIEAMYAIEPIPSEVLASEEDLNKLREIRNTLDSDAIQADEEILKLYGEIEELLPELGDTHGTTVDEMIKDLDEYIRQQEAAIANMQSLGGFEVKEGGGLVRQPTDRTAHPATPGDRETV
ncbi:MAG: phage tail tape measure protein, partial [Bacilli bacterium]